MGVRAACATTVMCVALSACGTVARSVDLADLVQHQDSFNGVRLSARGDVRAIHDASGDYFVLEDEHQDRVAMLPSARAAPYSGQQVEVVGTFRFDQKAGRRIEIESIVAR